MNEGDTGERFSTKEERLKDLLWRSSARTWARVRVVDKGGKVIVGVDGKYELVEKGRIEELLGRKLE